MSGVSAFARCQGLGIVRKEKEEVGRQPNIKGTKGPTLGPPRVDPPIPLPPSIVKLESNMFTTSERRNGVDI
jgi:hypothetical protein